MVYFVDGIWGMEGEGPLKGDDKHVGLLAMGDDPVEFDAKLAYFMGFDPLAVPHIGYWRELRDLAIGAYPARLEPGLPNGPRSDFREPVGWQGKLRPTTGRLIPRARRRHEFSDDLGPNWRSCMGMRIQVTPADLRPENARRVEVAQRTLSARSVPSATCRRPRRPIAAGARATLG